MGSLVMIRFIHNHFCLVSVQLNFAGVYQGVNVRNTLLRSRNHLMTLTCVTQSIRLADIKETMTTERGWMYKTKRLGPRADP